MRANSRILNISVLLACLLLAACAEKPIVPVIERAPVSPPPKAAKIKAESVRVESQEKDWRPDTHTVKKGDTLFSLGLQYGEDYKEIARINQISPPYVIRINQVLKLRETPSEKEVSSAPSSNGKPEPTKPEPTNQSAASNPSDNVILAPQQTESVSPVIRNEVITQINRPKAMREAYSDKALAAGTANANNEKLVKNPTEATAISQPEVTKNASIKGEATTANQPSGATKIGTESATDASASTLPNSNAVKPANSEPEENIEWLWPTTGKLLTSFNDGSSKGIDIGGVNGQAIIAAARGKVIYAGSDLRGYGKLVIIKHSKNYLSVYAHNRQILVKEGQSVQKGQKISEMGNTDTDTIKLHFEIRYQGRSVDPAKYLPNAQNP